MPGFAASVGRDIAVSIVAMVVLGAVSYLFDRRLHLVERVREAISLLRQVRRYLVHNYDSWDECLDEIARELELSDSVSIISIKGRELTAKPESFKTKLRSRAVSGKNTRILLQSPSSSHVSEEVRIAFGWDSLIEYREDLINAVRRMCKLSLAAKSDGFSVALYDSEPILKLFMFDDSCMSASTLPSGLESTWAECRACGAFADDATA